MSKPKGELGGRIRLHGRLTATMRMGKIYDFAHDLVISLERY
jgi:hypothetical protein